MNRKIIKRCFLIFIIMFLVLLFYFLIQKIPDFLTKEDYKCKDCNIVLISIDTLRADHLGVYDYERNTTPNIDKFSEESIIFKNVFSQASSTLPSHSTMMTSLYPITHRAESVFPLSEKYLTLAEVLKSNDYKTAAFVGGGQITVKSGLNQGFDVYVEAKEDGVTCDFRGFSKPGCMRQTMGEMLSWIDKYKEDKFFIFYHTYVTHHPYLVDDEKYQRFIDDELYGDESYHMRRFSYGIIDQNESSLLISHIEDGKINPDEKLIRMIIGSYDNTIYLMDDQIQKLFEKLDSENLIENTIVIFTSDHGEEFNEHGKIGIHAHTLYNELLYVPLIMEIPNYEPGEIEQQVRLIDITPTILDILKIKAEKEFQGTSLTPIIKGQKKELPIFSSMEYKDSKPQKIALQRNQFKLIYNFLDVSYEFYDLSVDKYESKNIINDGTKKEIKDAMKKELLKWYSENEMKEIENNSIQNEDYLNKLKSLGYI